MFGGGGVGPSPLFFVWGVARADEAGVVGGDEGLGAVWDAEFVQDVGDVGFDGFHAQEQVGGVFGVGQACGHEGEGLGFAGG